jgi:hypothetical protein
LFENLPLAERDAILGRLKAGITDVVCNCAVLTEGWDLPEIGCVIAALIYGHNDFVETLRTSFNLGWDADCDGATAATVVGVLKGRRWMNDQGWNIKDVYRNTTRDDMPNDRASATKSGLDSVVPMGRPLTCVGVAPST